MTSTVCTYFSQTLQQPSCRYRYSDQASNDIGNKNKNIKKNFFVKEFSDLICAANFEDVARATMTVSYCKETTLHRKASITVGQVGFHFSYVLRFSGD
jgi:hypothetical protein